MPPVTPQTENLEELNQEEELQITIEEEAGEATNLEEAGEAPAEPMSAEDRAKAALSADPELAEFGKGVERRINKLTYNWREAERQRDEAVRYAQQVISEMQQMRTQHGQFETELGEAKRTRVESEMASAKAKLKEAINLNDPDAIADAQALIGRLGGELATIPAPRQGGAQQPTTQFQRPPAQAPMGQHPGFERPRTQPQQPDTRALKWAEDNKWFGSDRIMTQAALQIHQQLVLEEDYTPQSEDYYIQVDKRMRENFPAHKFGKPAAGQEAPQRGQSPATVITTPGGRQPRAGTPRRGGGKVTLTQSQVAMANRLGVPLEEYARQVQKMQNG